MAGKKYFRKLDRSRAYHCIPIAVKRSIQFLSFNFGSRTLAYLSLAQDINCFVSAISSVVREYLDPSFKAGRCVHYVDDRGQAANTPDELIEALELAFRQLGKAGLKLSIGICEIGQKQIE